MVRRISYLVSAAGLLSLSSCLPDNFLPNLLGSSISGVASAILSDVLNVVLPPI